MLTSKFIEPRWGGERSYAIYDTRNEKPRIQIVKRFLYEAIYIPEGVEAPPRSVIDFPELQEYIIEFGNRKHDKALVAEIQGDIVGAIWVRIMNDYGHIDNDTPSLAMSVCPRYRGLGIGTSLLKQLLQVERLAGYSKYPCPFRKVIMQWKCMRKWDLLLLTKMMRSILWL